MLPGRGHSGPLGVRFGRAARARTVALNRLGEQDPTLAAVTARIVRTAMSPWGNDDSSSSALEKAARQLLNCFERPLVDGPSACADPERASAQGTVQFLFLWWLLRRAGGEARGWPRSAAVSGPVWVFTGENR